MLLGVSGLVTAVPKGVAAGALSDSECVLRPCRYDGQTAPGHVFGLISYLESAGKWQTLDACLVTVGNGPDYCADAITSTLLWARMFLGANLLSLRAFAHAPYHSAYHWQIEGRWSQLRREVDVRAVGAAALPDTCAGDYQKLTGDEIIEVTNCGLGELKAVCEAQGARAAIRPNASTDPRRKELNEFEAAARSLQSAPTRFARDKQATAGTDGIPCDWSDVIEWTRKHLRRRPHLIDFYACDLEACGLHRAVAARRSAIGRPSSYAILASLEGNGGRTY